MREKIRAVVAREARPVTAAETQRAGGAVLARQRHERGAFEIQNARKQQVMIRAHVGTKPRLVQDGELRRQSDQRIDEEDLLELFRTIAARDQ